MLRAYDRVLIPEMNLGQLAMLIRAKYLIDAVSYDKVNGMPFKAAELADVIAATINEAATTSVVGK